MTAWHGFNFERHPHLQVAKERLSVLYEANQGAVILAGHTGCGKSHLAKYLVEQYGAGAFFLTESKLVSEIRVAIQQNKELSLTEYRKAKLLVLDDVGVAYVKDESLHWLREYYWQLFEGREKLTTVITTNLTWPKLGERIGKRAYSRLAGLMGSRNNFVNLFEVDDYRIKDF